MSLHLLTTGTLTKPPEQRTGQSGKPYVLANIKSNDGEDTYYLSVFAFDKSACSTLLECAHGDAIAVSGRCRLSVWTGRDGTPKPQLTLTADRVMTTASPRHRAQDAPAPERDTGQADFDDAIPF